MRLGVIGVVCVVSVVAAFAASAGEIARPTASKRATATSSSPSAKFRLLPDAVADGAGDTAWCEGAAGAGVGEAVAFYVANGSLMGGPQDITVNIHRGFQRDTDTYYEYGRPTKLRVELYGDNTLLASAEVSTEHAISEVVFRKVPATNGVIWLKATILAVDPATKWQETCISEIRPSFATANPHNAREYAGRLCDLVNNPKIKETNSELLSVVKSVRKYFILPDDPKAPPDCRIDTLAVVSDDAFELWGALEGDAGMVLRFRLTGIVFKLEEVGIFILYD